MPDVHLGPEGSDHSVDYIHTVHWAQTRITPCRIGSLSESHENAMSTVFPTAYDRILRDG
jgi:hypothetical protein